LIFNTGTWFGAFTSKISTEIQTLKCSWIDSEPVTLQPLESRIGEYRSISSCLNNFSDWLQSFNNPGDDWDGQRKFLEAKSPISKGTRRELTATAAVLDDTQRLLKAGPVNGVAVEDWFSIIKERIQEAAQKGFKAHARLTSDDFLADELRRIEADKLLSTAGWFGAAIVTTALALAYGWARWRFTTAVEARPVMSTEAMKDHLKKRGIIK
jgi:hypothetical protein